MGSWMGVGRPTTANPFTNPEFLHLRYHTTKDIIQAVNKGIFPGQAMLNFHPQRWNDAFVPWVKELVWQNVKNQGKRLLITFRKKNADDADATDNRG